jgi:hypothetical protein
MTDAKDSPKTSDAINELSRNNTGLSIEQRTVMHCALERLRTFHNECEARCHTDTGEAWDLINDLHAAIQTALQVTPPVPAPSPVSIEILWGDPALAEVTDELPTETFTFKTQAELTAFREGVAVSNGWAGYDILYTDEELDNPPAAQTEQMPTFTQMQSCIEAGIAHVQVLVRNAKWIAGNEVDALSTLEDWATRAADLLPDDEPELKQVLPQGARRAFHVWMRLVEKYYAVDEDHAFDQAMADIENRNGMEISSHEIIEIDRPNVAHTVTVTPLCAVENLHELDKCVPGTYTIIGYDEDEVLDEFHSRAAIKNLDDFEITVTVGGIA